MNHRSYNQFHLGDNLIHLHFLRHLAPGRTEDLFTHAVHGCHLAQLHEAVADVPNIRLVDLESAEGLHCLQQGYDAWKNAGAGTSVGGYWERHPFRNDFTRFYLDWFQRLSDRMELPSPFYQPEHLLFNYQRIREAALLLPRVKYDTLVINSQPCSGQFRAFDRLEWMDPLIADLIAAGRRVAVTARSEVPAADWTGEMNLLRTAVPGMPLLPAGLSIGEIGGLSCLVENIIMVATGPSWPTFNIWNRDTVKFRLIFLDQERLNLSPPGRTVHADSMWAGRNALRERGLIK